MGGGKGKTLSMSQRHLTKKEFRQSLPDYWSEEEKDLAISYVNAFTGKGYGRIRHNPDGAEATLIEDVLAKSNNKWQGKTIYRGIGMTPSELRTYHVGKVIDQKGLSSWSNDFSVADVFADSGVHNYREGEYPVRVIFEDSASRSMNAMSIRGVSQVYYDQEVLRSSKSRQEILSIEIKRTKYAGDYYHIKVQEYQD